MNQHSWIKEFHGAITVCDRQGIILELNDAALEVFKDDGGAKLIGTNMLDCHPEPARSQLISMMKTQQKNVYTTERRGIKNIIYQAPWYENGEYAGFVEMQMEIPFEMQNFIRG